MSNKSFKVKLQKLGTSLSNMVMPNIPALIAWGVLTALVIPNGYLPNEELSKMVSPMLTYVIPLLIAFTGGFNVYGHRGGVVGAVAAFGAVAGSTVPMIIGAMIMGPLTAWLMKKFDQTVQPKIKPGFEMLVNNFSAGFLAFGMMLLAFYSVGPVVANLTTLVGQGVDALVTLRLLPLANIIIEPVTYGEYKNVVFLDPGHGGRDPGAVYNGLREKDLNMSIYRKLRSELEKLGYTVLTSRDKDVYVDYITERSEMVNKTDADVFISIHFNATGVPGANRSGVETYIYEPDDDIKPRINKVAHDNPVRLSESKRLADNIHNSVVSVAGANDRGVHGSNYAVLRETVKPAVLIELGYMDSPEYKKISDDKYQNKLVEGLVKGLRNFYKTAK